MPEKADWGKWYEERIAFQGRDTAGFTADLTALRSHIKALREASPKDEAGVPVTTALIHIARLVKGLNQAQEYLDQNKP